jgi:anti-sigma regulatory factor (Ser/Thr protein kinase)
LVFYSDGVTEAENEMGEFFGTHRLIDLLQKNTSLPAAALAQSVVTAVDTFSKGPRSDDLTIIVVKALPRTVPFRFPGDFGHLDEAVELIRALGQAYETNFAYELELAASEIVTNIIEHAYQNSGGELRGEVHLETNRVQVDFYDDGLPFDISALSPKERHQASERGYGVHIVRQVMDEITYTPATRSGNHWRLVKTRRRETPDDGRRP